MKIFLVIPFLLIFSCSNSQNESPETVALNYLTAGKSRDYELMKNLMDSSSRNFTDSIIKKEAEKFKTDEERKQYIKNIVKVITDGYQGKSFKINRSQINGVNAEVWINEIDEKEPGMSGVMKIHLIKEKDVWRIVTNKPK